MAKVNSDVSKRAVKILEQIKTGLKPDIDKEVQKELGKLASLTPDIGTIGSEEVVAELEVAVEALLTSPANTELAVEIRGDLEQRLRRLRGGFIGLRAPSTRVVLGLGVLFYVAIPFWIFLAPHFSDKPQIFGVSTELIAVVAIFGGMGSIVSIMVRLADFKQNSVEDGTILFFTGLFKPIVGIAFAMFVFAALESGLLPIEVNPDQKTFFYAALAFLAGFSERFAKDVADKAEAAVGL